ncbi:MAG TPA: hypothetical protein PLB62_11975 [Candidatus Sumerlaeota bacterium]|nr:hypothetical protein [Candidatus Sumerlaeota bacterium]
MAELLPSLNVNILTINTQTQRIMAVMKPDFQPEEYQLTITAATIKHPGIPILKAGCRMGGTGPSIR